MESGAGKHWTEEEVKALLSVWSEKNIRKQLHGTLRNKGIFIYIAKRLQELGVCRDWKQCRAKYKNLKYEYRTVKYAHNSGDVTKTMKFFHDLDAILRYEPVTQLAAEENGRCSATETQLNTSPTTDSTQEMPGDTGEEDSVSNMSEDLQVADTKKVSDSDDAIVNTTPENRAALHITKETAMTKILEDEGDFANSTPVALEATQVKKETIDIDDDSISTTSEDRSCTPVAKRMVGTDNHIPLEEAQNHFKVITVNDTGAGKHWSDNEVRALINIWSDEKIQQMLEGATRNKEIFEEIARRLMKRGIDRDWKQCRTKYKNLKYEYRALQKENEHLGNPKRKMRFYDEVDCILRRQPLGTSGWGCESSSPLSVSVADAAANTGSLSIKRKTWNDEVSPVPLKKSASENTIFHFQKLLTERVHTVTEGKKLLFERLCKQEEMQDLNRTQLYADPSAIQQGTTTGLRWFGRRAFLRPRSSTDNTRARPSHHVHVTNPGNLNINYIMKTFQLDNQNQVMMARASIIQITELFFFSPSSNICIIARGPLRLV
ncbi:trihelix transcription factor PTL isoform X10 [Cyanistes caeruleus]|uniref:trihelix transcription factor PTL isoform X10 n=1 Tax=Cyanistes caeruleus TaxID=156563 RepID=UPI000CDB27CC|nr:trihelix transcription factor PTL isoform X10 [Cyanistes caeruleus]